MQHLHWLQDLFIYLFDQIIIIVINLNKKIFNKLLLLLL